jgi:hypothetical protein
MSFGASASRSVNGYAHLLAGTVLCVSGEAAGAGAVARGEVLLFDRGAEALVGIVVRLEKAGVHASKCGRE